MLKSLDKITDEDLQEVTRLAALFYTPREIAIMMEFDSMPFIFSCTEQDNKFFNAFQRGRLQSETDLRTSTIKLAKAGSSPAATMAMDLLNKSKIKMLDR